MKKFILCLCAFALLFLACDFSLNIIGRKLFENAKGGETARKNYIANNTNQDVLIFGSSRAVRHYNPAILSDTLGMTAYDCGLFANGIICTYGFIRIIEDRYYPKVLIYDITPWYDLTLSDNHKFLAHLRFFYDRPYIKTILSDVDKTERYKMVSRIYRYNYVFPEMIIDNIHPLLRNNNGYRPLDKEMPPEIKPMEKQTSLSYDSLKLNYLEKLIMDCKGKTQLIFTASPLFENTDDAVLDPIKKMCAEEGIPIITHYADSTFNNKRAYFCDRNHLNRTGATEYSKVIAHEIKDILAQRTNIE
ncbi:MAG: hypothetical protein LUC91_01410 [Prevotella sp.]|nr:hypothetical protein [Prevotella sp.]